MNKCIRLIPPFEDKDVEKYFVLFTRAAKTRQWPMEIWPWLLQSVFTGKAQDAYASLTPERSVDYNHVKAAVLGAYELVLEAYRKTFLKN